MNEKREKTPKRELTKEQKNEQRRDNKISQAREKAEDLMDWLKDELDDDQLTVLGQVADLAEAKASVEFEADLENDPVERIFSRFDSTIEKMVEQGLTADVGLVENFKKRFEIGMDIGRVNLAKADEELEYKPNIDSDGTSEKYRVIKEFPISSTIGEKGGGTFYNKALGKSSKTATSASMLESPDVVESMLSQNENLEYINQDLSKEGLTILLQELGVTEEGETIFDASNRMAVSKGGRPKSHDPNHVNLSLPTDIEGASIKYKRTNHDGWYDGEQGTMVDFNLDSDFLDVELRK